MLLINFKLEDYYAEDKKQTLQEAFTDINAAFLRSETHAVTALNHYGSNVGLEIVLFNSGRLIYHNLTGGLGQNEQQIEVWVNQLLNALSQNIPKQTEETAVATYTDPRLGTNFITLVGVMNGGSLLLLRTPMEAIIESVSVTNRFLLISGGVSLLIGLLVVLWVARSFTKPVKTLSGIAERVAQLDFSERYTARGKDELGQLGENLNRMSDELEAAYTQLREANVRLVEENRLKTEQAEARRMFITNVSHELKTPIALIQTYAEGLRETIAADPDYYCGVIEDESQKMAALLGKMMALMQIESGSQPLEIERFDLTGLANNVARLLSAANPRQVRLELPREPAYVKADRFLIEHVLTNYLSNAYNHVEEEGTVSVSIRSVEGGALDITERIQLTVFNSGSHIPEADLPRIWENFYKTDKARTRTYGGSGIGLSVVTAIMKAHGMPYGVRNCTAPDGVAFMFELEAAEAGE
ncbi:MAG: HAMP domain-containing histidine kinase [Oscillospiraceae bacterium]|nr:HAMP domain-containing histidine kinase [Oscillospiraceae bacterium]